MNSELLFHSSTTPCKLVYKPLKIPLWYIGSIAFHISEEENRSLDWNHVPWKQGYSAHSKQKREGLW